MQSTDLKEFFRNQLTAVKSDYLKDLDALQLDQLESGAGGSSRSPLDLTFEIVHVNRRIARRIRGEVVEPNPYKGWMKSPEGYAAEAKDAFSSAMDEVIEAWASVPEDEMMKSIPLPEGETHALDLVWMVCYHTGYHDGQLNYLQAIHGDEAVHW